MRKDNDQFVLIDKDNDIHLLAGGEEALAVFMWGRRVDDYTCFTVVGGGLERFHLPANLSELLNKPF